MSFASLEFFSFLILVYGLYVLLPRRGQNVLLLGASYYFYGSWDWRFLSLIWASTILDFVIGKSIHNTENPGTRRSLLLVSLVVNLGFLAFFKYFGFFIDSFGILLSNVGIQPSWPALTIILPVGISFYTFQTLSYTIDIYRRKLEPVDNLLDFALFVAFFPQLVAGPIERASHFLPQVLAKRSLTVDATTRGCYLILLGLFKKIAISDGVAGAVNAIYTSPDPVGTVDIVLATYLFAVQIYCDFSGYTDIARGVTKLLGFDLMVNFNTPYFSVNPSDFWRRWHISLSTWLRDYLYIPLGGSRNGTRSTYRNLMLTMALGGLWHGAAWNFIYWGVYQGAILCVHRLVAGAKPTIRPVTTLWDGIRRTIVIVGFFQVTCYGWMLFRASSWQQIWTFTDRLFFNPVWTAPTLPPLPIAATVGIALVFAIDLVHYLSGKAAFYRRWPASMRSALYAALLGIVLLGLGNEGSTFIYFQF